MTSERNKLAAVAAFALILAAGGGFLAARLTTPENPPAVTTGPSPGGAAASPGEEVRIDDEGIRSSQIAVAPAGQGGLNAAIEAPGTVQATPDAEALVTARAPGTIVRILARLGDNVRAGQTIALVESREASTVAADRGAAAARVTLAARQLERERYLLSQGVSPRADFETAQANLQVAQAEARRAAAAGGTIRATGDGRTVAVQSPIDGRLSASRGQLGASVQAETELFRVVDPSRLEIVANMPPGDAARVRAGDRVEITLSEGNTIEGRVRSAIRDVNPETRQASVVIVLNGSGFLLAPGELVRTRVLASGGRSGAAVVVPQDAVQTLGDRTVVFVRTRTGFRAQPISAGARSSGLVEVLAGLQAGTPIATTNAFRLKSELLKEEGE